MLLPCCLSQVASGNRANPSVKSASMDHAGFGRHFTPVAGAAMRFGSAQQPPQPAWLPPQLDIFFSAPSPQQELQQQRQVLQQQQQLLRRGQQQRPPPPSLVHKFGSLSLSDAERDAAFGSLCLSVAERDAAFAPPSLATAFENSHADGVQRRAPA